MAVDIRAVGRTVGYRTGSGKLKPAIMTVVGVGTQANLRVGHTGGTFANVSKWSRSTPATPGWEAAGR